MRATFILPWFDRHAEGPYGGWLEKLVPALAAHCEVEVLTTCARDPASWRDYHDPGSVQIGGVRVQRFRVDYPRSPRLAERLRGIVVSPASTAEIERRWIEEEGPYSSALLRHLDRRRAERETFVFFGCTAATTVLGIPRVGGKAVLVPLAGAAAALGVACIREVFDRSRGFVFESAAERDRLRGLFAPSVPHAIAGSPGDNHPPDATRAAAAYAEVLRQLES